MAGNVAVNGVIWSEFIKALYIETTAYGVQENMNIPFFQIIRVRFFPSFDGKYD